MNTLMILLKDGPEWMKKECGAYLSKCLMNPTGLSVLMDRLLDVPGSEEASYKVILRLVSTCPRQFSKQVKFAFSFVS